MTEVGQGCLSIHAWMGYEVGMAIKYNTEMHFYVIDFLEVHVKCFFDNWSPDNLKYSKIPHYLPSCISSTFSIKTS